MDDTSLPNFNCVRFFILTNQGRFVADEKLENFDNGSSKWLELFIEANVVISELREMSEDFKQ